MLCQFLLYNKVNQLHVYIYPCVNFCIRCDTQFQGFFFWSVSYLNFLLPGFFFFFLILFIYLFLAVLGLHFCTRVSLVVASGGHSSSRCVGLSLSRPLLLRSTGSKRASSVVVAHGPSCSVACGIFPDQGSNPCPLHWQADSQPLRHQGSPYLAFSNTVLPHYCQMEVKVQLHYLASIEKEGLGSSFMLMGMAILAPRLDSIDIMFGFALLLPGNSKVLDLHLTVSQWERGEAPCYCPMGVEVLGPHLVSADIMGGSGLLPSQRFESPSSQLGPL